MVGASNIAVTEDALDRITATPEICMLELSFSSREQGRGLLTFLNPPIPRLDMKFDFVLKTSVAWKPVKLTSPRAESGCVPLALRCQTHWVGAQQIQFPVIAPTPVCFIHLHAQIHDGCRYQSQRG